MEEQTLQQLAETYCKEPADALRNAIISKSMPLLRSILGKISKPDQPLTAREDLESAGIRGILQAIDSYDCSKNIQFNTFAYYRIRGSIIDYLRKIDQLPRNQRKTYGEVQQVIRQKTQELGREPGDEEVAPELGMSLEEYRKLLGNVQQRNALSLDMPFEGSGSGSTLYDVYADPESEGPDRELEKNEQVNHLREVISGLEERDRLILTLYYFEDMTMSEIALLLELSEARISQIIGKLLLELRDQLRGKELFSPAG